MTCRLEAIFNGQKELMEKFHPIERIRMPATPAEFLIDETPCQVRAKEYAWRVTEELGEMANEPDLEKKKEEISDALHFFVELCIYIRMTPEDLRAQAIPSECRLETTFLDATEIYDRVNEPEDLWWFAVVIELSKAMNELKNRPWKRFHTPTDKEKFQCYIRETYHAFIRACIASGIETASELTDIYFRKHAVNVQRAATR